MPDNSPCVNRINPAKIVADKTKQVVATSSLQQMQMDMFSFFQLLMIDNPSFEPENAFKFLEKYIRNHNRILYSVVSNNVYDVTDEDNSGQHCSKQDRFGTLLSNIEKLVDYVDDDKNISMHKITESSFDDKRIIDDTKKAVWKIWDHVNLARRQYDVLRQSDSEYDEKFEKRISKFQSKISGELNSQLLTMVGIFTALAFILFGGISSLQSVFEGLQETHILKLLIISCGWGLGMLNVVFVFLFCVSKMTKLNFKSTMAPDATFWQRYPVVCWTDFLLCIIIVILLWLSYCISCSGMGWLDNLMEINPAMVSIIGFFIIVGVAVVGFMALVRKTKSNVGDEDE